MNPLPEINIALLGLTGVTVLGFLANRTGLAVKPNGISNNRYLRTLQSVVLVLQAHLILFISGTFCLSHASAGNSENCQGAFVNLQTFAEREYIRSCFDVTSNDVSLEWSKRVEQEQGDFNLTQHPKFVFWPIKKFSNLAKNLIDGSLRVNSLAGRWSTAFLGTLNGKPVFLKRVRLREINLTHQVGKLGIGPKLLRGD